MLRRAVWCSWRQAARLRNENAVLRLRTSNAERRLSELGQLDSVKPWLLDAVGEAPLAQAAPPAGRSASSGSTLPDKVRSSVEEARRPSSAGPSAAAWPAGEDASADGARIASSHGGSAGGDVVARLEAELAKSRHRAQTAERELEQLRSGSVGVSVAGHASSAGASCASTAASAAEVPAVIEAAVQLATAKIASEREGQAAPEGAASLAPASDGQQHSGAPSDNTHWSASTWTVGLGVADLLSQMLTAPLDREVRSRYDLEHGAGPSSSARPTDPLVRAACRRLHIHSSNDTGPSRRICGPRRS